MAERSFQLQQEIRNNAQELGDFLKELSKWENDIKRKDDELKKTAEIEQVEDVQFSVIFEIPQTYIQYTNLLTNLLTKIN